ncbi:MAG: DUF1501 domain-containing protein, partial [Opitutaceae bacterium]
MKLKPPESLPGVSCCCAYVWGGEFGRTPMAQGTGRDHHLLGFS